MFTWISNTNGSQTSSGIPWHRDLISKLKVFRGDKDVRRSPSPLHPLLKSNAKPSDSEVIAIRASITDEACIEELHSRFPTHDPASQVTDSESQLPKIIETHRALLSPIRYLPTEILQEIFLHYADNLLAYHYDTIATMPWRLGHISHRWRQIALSLPSLWDNIPKISILDPKPKQSYVRALICLIQRSGTSPTLKFDIRSSYFLLNLRNFPKNPIINEIMLHSERIEQLRIMVDKSTMPFLQGFKGRLPNLRILRLFLQVNLNANELPKFDVFEFAPALRQVAVGGSYQDSSVRILLPWSQITHFEEQLPAEGVGQLEPLSSLHSLTYLDIDKRRSFEEFAVPSPYRPTTLPNLRTLRVLIPDSDRDYKNVDLFLESLTIPAVEVMKIFYREPLISHLVSMFSGSRGPSRLQKLAFRTIPLQTGELSTLLMLTPHLVELDIDVPPADDLLRLIYGVGEVMLVPMLQILYMHSPGVLTAGTQTEHFDTLAQFRCELGRHKDSEDTTMPSLGSGTQATLHTLRIFFDSAESRDSSQKILNKWSSSFTPEEVKAIDMISRCSNYINGVCGKSFVLASENNAILFNLDQLLADIEHYEVTNKVLHETNLHIFLLHRFIRLLMILPDQGTYKLKERAMDISVKLAPLLLEDLSGYRWARTSELRDSSNSLVYVSKSKYHGEPYVSVQSGTVEVLISHSSIHAALRMSLNPDAGLSIAYGLELPFEAPDWFWWRSRFLPGR